MTPANRKYFVDVFEDWVSETRFIFDPTNLILPYSYYDNVDGIVNYLIEKSSTSELSRQKYPFICLVDDFTKIEKLKEPWYRIDPTIYIFSETLIESTPSERYTNVIKPVLYPIRDILLNVIKYSNNISPANIATTLTENIFKGQISNDLKISDTVDCVRLKFSELLIKKQC
jgi:hypothetical protein